ncbi:MAG TPA: hypothetical protein H9730_13125 [Candidatus Mediterraneibacter stercoripullorum]|nr:hypothetical protein [Candidatus Mediterraneibacter stercoripullorum]
MLTLIFLILLLWIFIKLLIFGVKAAWGISRIILTILWPVILIGLIIAGLFYIAVPALVIFAVIAFVVTRN